MKKVLLTTSALVAFGLAAPAYAQQSTAGRLQLGLGGFMKQEFGYAKNDNFTPGSDRKGFDQQSDAEVYFRGTLKLDNGISVMVHIELEAETSADTIDEQYVRVFGSFGDLRMGSLNNAAYQMSYHAPDYGVGYNEAFIYSYLTTPGGGFATQNSAVFLQTQRLSVDNDSNKIAYFTPRFFGFQGGVSYTPDHEDNGDAFRSGDTRYRDGLSAAINYDNRFGSFYLAGNLGYYGAKAPANSGVDDISGWNAGLNVGFGGFLIGGGYQKYTKGVVSQANGGTGGSTTTFGTSAKSNVWNIGAAYNFGPGGISLTYQKGEADGTAAPGDNKMNVLLLSGRYNLGPGVSLYGTLAKAEYEDEIAATSVGNNDAWGLIGGIRVDF